MRVPALLLCLLGAAGCALATQQATHNPLERISVAALTHALDPSIQLRVNATVLHSSGEWFNVSWSGVPRPSYADWIGLWVPADANFSATAPAKYKIAASSDTHVTEGRGSLSFRLISYRQDMVFAFMRGGLMRPQLAALTQPIRVANPNQPLHGHLALTGDNTEMRVQWATHNSSRPVVRWGARPGEWTWEAPGATTTYTRGELCGAPATTVGWVAPGALHAARLTGLVPGQRYYYTYGDEDWGFAPEASFRAAPPVGPDIAVKLLAVADLGQGEVDGSMEQSEMLPSLNTTRLMEEQGEEYQLLVHNGDISYARGYVTQWDNYMHQMEPLARRMPYMVAPGNHERNWPGSGDGFDWGYDSGGECGVAYERRLAMPTPGADKQWYAFDFGPIHFLQYSTEHDFRPGSEQHAFILSDLASVNRSLTPWLIVGGHRPFYISSNNRMEPDGDQTVASALRATYEQVFLDYKVDMTWHGHHHSYQRSCPAAAGACAPADADGVAGGPIHLVIGNAGADLSLNVELFPARIWRTIRLWFGFLRVEADGRRLRTELVSDLDGRVVDVVELSKPEGWGRRFMAARHAGGGGGASGGRVVEATR